MVVKESPTLKIVLHTKKHSVQIEVGGFGDQETKTDRSWY